MSGRGLSFSGGTIDKLEGIPGWSASLSMVQFRRQLREVGLVVAAQTATLAPADQRLYALRDVTGTVPSLPLIAASIMSKKLAAGADGIVLDVKCGRGAFMETRSLARDLAQLMVSIGRGAGRGVTALITAMEQPLGRGRRQYPGGARSDRRASRQGAAGLPGFDRGRGDRDALAGRFGVA